MLPLSADDVIAVWERGQGQPETVQALTLLSAALPDQQWSDLAALPLGERDQWLLRLRRKTLGSEMRSYVKCPNCDAMLDFPLKVEQFLLSAAEKNGDPVLLFDGYEIHYRLPDSEDFFAMADCQDVQEAQDLLLRRCILETRHQGNSVDLAQIPPHVVPVLGEKMEQDDPLAELPVQLECTGCDNHWLAMFEIGPFFWQEISALAKRLMDDVANLARVYGWSEKDILSMSATRRQYYLELGQSS